jgi:hypothetical protein
VAQGRIVFKKNTRGLQATRQPGDQLGPMAFMMATYSYASPRGRTGCAFEVMR